MSDFQFFMPIAKVDTEKRTVSGYASTPTKDGDGEIVTLDAIRGALPDYMTYGNIREMHKLNAVGVAQEANMDNKGLFLTAKIVDDDAWNKCLEGVYKGFSIGGRKLAKTGNKITEIEMTEISVVDRPSNPDCKMSLAKSAKSIGELPGYLLKIKKKPSAEGKALAKMAKIVGDLAKAGPPAAHDGFSLPAKVKPAEDPDGTISVNDARPAENVTRKAGDAAVPCDAHGKIGCEKCAAEKVAGDESAARLSAENKEAKKKAKKAKKAAKKATAVKIAKAFGIKNNSFLTLRKNSSGIAEEAAPVFETLKKGMSTAGSLAYTFDSIRSAQRSLMMEAKREGGDMKDKALATRLGGISKDLADIISQKAQHEGAEALDLSDVDDQYVVTLFGEDMRMAMNGNQIAGTGDPMVDAMQQLMKRATTPSRMQRMAMAEGDVKKTRKACKAAREAIEDVHKMLKASYIAKAAKKDDKKDDDEFDHAEAMGKLQKAYQEIDKARTMAKAASAQITKAMVRSGQRGQEAGDPESGFFEVPAGVTDLTPAALAGAAPGTKGGGSQPPMYPTDGGVFPGKAAGNGNDLAKYARNGVVSVEVAELLMKNRQAEGELEALRRMPAVGSSGRRPYAFDMTKVMGGTNNSGNGTEVNEALFKGVNVGDLDSQDERARVAASAKVAGNFLLSGHFGKSVFDPAFNGAAGSHN